MGTSTWSEPASGDLAAVPEPVSDRIVRMRRRYQRGAGYISVERARHYTAGWRETEGSGMPRVLRVAHAMRRVYENMTVYLDHDEVIAGTWTERFFGVPIDIEKGVYNSVLEAELCKSTMVAFRARAMVKALYYLLRKRSLGDFVRNQRIVRKTGRNPLNLDFQTMSERQINRYFIDPGDRRELLRDLLPYWHGRSLVDRLCERVRDAGLYSRDMRDFSVALPGNTSRQVLMLSACTTIATIQGHVILDYETPVRVGLRAMRHEVQEHMAEHAPGSDERVFLEAVDGALGGVAVFARRLADRVERALREHPAPGRRRRELSQMLEVCRRVPMEPARTFREAVQALWTVKTAVELAHPMNLHCFGRLDQLLWPYYRDDVAAGRITRSGARELLEELLLKIMSQNVRPESNILSNFYHRFLGSSPVTIGGVKADGSDASNEVSRLFVEAAHRSRAVTNLSVRVHPETPDALLDAVARCTAEGTSSYAVFNDEVHVDAMERRGFELEDARDYAVMGCVEATCPGKTGAMSASALLLSRLLDITLRNGSGVLLAGRLDGEGPRTGDPDTFECFDDLLDALQTQARYAVDKIVAGSNLKDELYAEMLPAPFVSAFVDGCVDSAKDVTQGGARYDLSGLSMINSIANLVDSLHVIRKLVFEERRLTFAQLLEAMDDNFEGHEWVLRAIRSVEGRWGNGDPEVDRLAHDVGEMLFRLTEGKKNARGGPFVNYMISMITHTIDGRLSIAGPDGRPAASPYAASANPYNVDRCGPTAVLRSLAALPMEHVMGSAANIRFHPSAVGTRQRTRQKWIALVRGFFRLGGAQLQPTAAGTELLEAARQNPEAHRDLIVKVGGYSTYFVDLGPEIQEEIIARTEHA